MAAHDDDDAILMQFSRRLHEVCDERGEQLNAQGRPVVRKDHGRYTDLGTIMGVSYKAVEKWFTGQGMPTLERAIALAHWGGVCVEWLLTGRGPKYPPVDSSAASQLGALAARLEAMDPKARELVTRLVTEACR